MSGDKGLPLERTSQGLGDGWVIIIVLYTVPFALQLPGDDIDYCPVTVTVFADVYIQNMVAEIHKETQLIDAVTKASVHLQLGAFVLVITSHGDEGSVIGSDGRHIAITDILDLLSPKNCPAMKGKPKVVIIQACSGGELEVFLCRNTVEAIYKGRLYKGTAA